MKNLLQLLLFLNILIGAFFPKLVLAQKSRPELNVYPYVFKKTTNICFTLPKADSVTLAVYDKKGNIVESILNKQWLDSGRYAYIFDSDTLPDGIYYVISEETRSLGKIGFSLWKDSSASELKLNIYPNPFLDSTIIQFKLPSYPIRANVTIEAYNMLGQKVAQILQDSLIEADTTVRLFFNAVALPASIYFIDFRISNCIKITKKAIKLNPASVLSTVNNQSVIKVFPNPFNDNISISGLETINGKLEIVNSLGKIVKTQNLNSQSEINLQLINIPAGAYFIKILNGDKAFPGINKLIIKN